MFKHSKKADLTRFKWCKWVSTMDSKMAPKQLRETKHDGRDDEADGNRYGMGQTDPNGRFSR